MGGPGVTGKIAGMEINAQGSFESSAFIQMMQLFQGYSLSLSRNRNEGSHYSLLILPLQTWE